MAAELIERMSGPWNAEKYTDDYRHALMNLIQKKIESGDKAMEGAQPLRRSPTKVIDLVSVLQESLKQAGSRGRKAAAPKRKTAMKKAA
jgi:DNA end-binding protein Ku